MTEYINTITEKLTSETIYINDNVTQNEPAKSHETSSTYPFLKAKMEKIRIT